MWNNIVVRHNRHNCLSIHVLKTPRYSVLYRMLMYECLLLIIPRYDHFHTTVRTFVMVYGCVAKTLVNY